MKALALVFLTCALTLCAGCSNKKRGAGKQDQAKGEDSINVHIAVKFLKILKSRLDYYQAMALPECVSKVYGHLISFILKFLSRIKRLEVEADEVMASFDVISFFTSIPPALAIDTIDGFLQEKYDETDQQLKRVHIIQLLELCLKTFFTFNGQVYEQRKGTPMGSPLSG
ncbi:hypothetical protein SprV_0802548900 [Sparganum proliferum]